MRIFYKVSRVTGFILLVMCVASCAIFKKEIKLESLDDGKAAKYAETITKEDLYEHLSVLASDEYEGRETAMPGQKKAANYIEEFFFENNVLPGLGEGGFQQSFPVEVKDPNKVSLSVEGKELTFLDDFYYIGNIADTILNNRDVVFLGYGIDKEGLSNYEGVDVEGKVVMVMEGIPKDEGIDHEWASWRKKLKTAISHGAVAVITIQNSYEEKIEGIRTFLENPTMQLHNKGKKRATEIPTIFISSKVVYDYFSIPEGGVYSILSEKISFESATRQLLSSENVLGVIEGSDKKDEIVVITAHYDHIGYDNGEICNGADDDGSGTVTLLELAQAFSMAKQEGNGPRRSIVFMTVSGEEKGLLGSKYYSENPVYPIENTIVDLNIDMIGRKDTLHNDANYVYLIGADRISQDLHDISEKVNKQLIDFQLDYTYNRKNDPNMFYFRSDHYNFAKKGIPVIFYFSGIHEDYHKPSDDIEKIMFPKLEKTARYIFYTAWELANREERIRKNAKNL